LRAKEATFSQIQDVLAQHGVIVSESGITRFCRKHLAEIQRLRIAMEQETELRPNQMTPGTTLRTGTAPSPSLGAARKIRDLRGEV
jgi:hypothetical protein